MSLSQNRVQNVFGKAATWNLFWHHYMVLFFCIYTIEITITLSLHCRPQCNLCHFFKFCLMYIYANSTIPLHLQFTCDKYITKNACCDFQTFFSDFSCEITEKALKWTKKLEKRLKKSFDQLLGARSTQKLVEIYNTRLFTRWTTMSYHWRDNIFFHKQRMVTWDLNPRLLGLSSGSRWGSRPLGYLGPPELNFFCKAFSEDFY